jgi:hypothetical protein
MENDMSKIISRTEAGYSGEFHSVEIDVHAYRRGTDKLSGIELSIDRQDAMKKRRDPYMCANLTIEAATQLRDRLNEILVRG